MFYQPLPLAHSCGFLPLALLPPSNPLLLQTLALALQKSVTNYSQAQTQPLPASQSPPTPFSSPAQPPQGKTAPAATQGALPARNHSEKNSEIESQKIASLGTINESKAGSEGDMGDSTLEGGVVQEANIPALGLSAQQRQIKKMALLERQVDGWRMERQRKKSTKITYNWY